MSDDVGYRPCGPLDPVAAGIAEFFGTLPLWTGMTTNPVAETRAAIKAMTPVSGEPAMEKLEDFRVPVSGGEIAVRLYRPASTVPALIVWAHGGGYALGSLDELDNFCRALAAASGCAVVSVEYRLAPEHKFPTAVEDMIAATLWADGLRRTIAGGDVPLVLGGDSAGANLATVATRKLHAEGRCQIAANVLAYPSTDTPDAPSLRRFVSPFITLEQVEWFHDQYLPDAAARTHPDFAPILAANLGVLPPSLFITAEHDILTEQVNDYRGKLAAAGVEVRSAHYPGMIHGFLTLDAFLPGAGGAAIREMSRFVSQLS